MTTPLEATERIYEAFATEWGVTSAYTFENEKFNPPEGEPWVRITVRHTPSVQESLGGIGNRKFERSGIVFVQCFVPENIGVAEALSMAYTALGIFEGKTLIPGAIRFHAVSVRNIGVSDGWYQVNMDASFLYTETK